MLYMYCECSLNEWQHRLLTFCKVALLCQPSSSISACFKRVCLFEWQFLVKPYHYVFHSPLTLQLLPRTHTDIQNSYCYKAYAGSRQDKGERFFFSLFNDIACCSWALAKILGPLLHKSLWFPFLQVHLKLCSQKC